MKIKELIKELEKYSDHESEVCLVFKNTKAAHVNSCFSKIYRDGRELIFLSTEKPEKEPPRPKMKYIVIGGLCDKKIGETTYKYLNAWELCHLYGVNPKFCHMLEEREPDFKVKLTALRKLELPMLRANCDGLYSKKK